MQVTPALAFFKSRGTATAAAQRVIAELTIRDFSETVMLTWDQADVYGVLIEDAGWYLKLTIDESLPEVAVISFHPLDRPIKTNGGMVKP